jgi:hypothetical protein
MRKKIATKTKETSIDDLAVMVQKGFLELRKDISEVARELKSEIGDVKVDLNQRVHIFDHKSLEYRVEKLEEKAGIAKKK